MSSKPSWNMMFGWWQIRCVLSETEGFVFASQTRSRHFCRKLSHQGERVKESSQNLGTGNLSLGIIIFLSGKGIGFRIIRVYVWNLARPLNTWWQSFSFLCLSLLIYKIEVIDRGYNRLLKGYGRDPLTLKLKASSAPGTMLNISPASTLWIFTTPYEGSAITSTILQTRELRS